MNGRGEAAFVFSVVATANEEPRRAHIGASGGAALRQAGEARRQPGCLRRTAHAPTKKLEHMHAHKCKHVGV